ncbi:MAG: hypothetical protein JWP82_2925 [Humibacillus sp.]|nr:hypothetical protein [Humibacillus sp.]
MNSSSPSPYAGIPLWLRPIPRRPGEVQFGVGEGGPIVTGVSADEARLLARLDGTMPPDALGAVAGAVGVSGRRWRVLLDLVARLGLLEPTGATRVSGSAGAAGAAGATATAAARATRPVPRQRTDHRDDPVDVLVEGPGSLSTALAEVLAAEPGLRVSHGSGDDVSVPVTSPRPVPGLVVLVADVALDPRRGDVWLAREVAHLPVVTTGPPVRAVGARTVVGPLIGPLVGPRAGAPDAPCLWCLDLHRSDCDDAWPTVMAQVAGLRGDAMPVTAAGLPHLVGGLVAALLARWLDGDPPPPGVALEVSLPWPRLDHRRWRAHPRCRQHALPGPPPAPLAGRT